MHSPNVHPPAGDPDKTGTHCELIPGNHGVWGVLVIPKTNEQVSKTLHSLKHYALWVVQGSIFQPQTVDAEWKRPHRDIASGEHLRQRRVAIAQDPLVQLSP